jgi:hypothetical protein
LTLALAGLLGVGVAGAGVAQLPKTYAVPKGPGGHSDLNGVWHVVNTANWNIEPHAASSALEMRAGPVVPVPAKAVVALGAVGSVPAGMGVVLTADGKQGGLIPYTTEAKAVRDENRTNYLARDPEVKCYLPGVPRGTYMDLPFQIFQSDNAMLMAYEYAGAVRNILFTDPGEAPVESWMGQSVGKWEGSTLVVTVTGQNDRTWFDRAGNHHSFDMTVTERYTPVSPYHVRYTATIHDPNTFTRDWTMSLLLYKGMAEDDRLQQFKCVEFVEELIYGHLRKNPLP